MDYKVEVSRVFLMGWLISLLSLPNSWAQVNTGRVSDGQFIEQMESQTEERPEGQSEKEAEDKTEAPSDEVSEDEKIKYNQYRGGALRISTKDRDLLS